MAATVKNPSLLDYILVNGDFEVHKHGCRDATRAIKAKVTHYTEVAEINIEPTDDFNDVIRYLWDDQIRESYDPAEDPEPDNAIQVPEVADGDNSSAAYTLPSPAWLSAHGYFGATHFNPCIRQWVSVTTQPCTGEGKEWKALPDTTAANVECPECGTTAGSLGLTPRKRNGKFRPLVPAHQVEVEELRTPSAPSGSEPASAKNGNSKAAAKRLLATHVALAIGRLVEEIGNTNVADASDETAEYRAMLLAMDPAEMLSVATTWIHHIPADRDRWVAAGLPKPDRSDWR